MKRAGTERGTSLIIKIGQKYTEASIHWNLIMKIANEKKGIFHILFT